MNDHHPVDGWSPGLRAVRWRSSILTVVVAAFACSGENAPSVTGPEKPAEKSYSFASVTGNDQSARAGEPLPVPITVLVKNESGLPHLLAPELGHAFGLAHVPDPSNFMDGTASAGGVTPGQIFVAHLLPTSAINSVYHLRPESNLGACCISDRFDF